MSKFFYSYKSISRKFCVLAYSWPGNVRELENVLHRAVLISDSSEITPIDINIKERERGGAVPHELGSSDNEKRMVFNTIGYCLGDMSKAASILGVSIEILREKLETYTK